MKDYMYYLSLFSTASDVIDGFLDESEGLTVVEMDEVRESIIELGKVEHFTNQQEKIFRLCLNILSTFEDLPGWIEGKSFSEDACRVLRDCLK